MTPDAKTSLVKALARQIGFDLIGVTLAAPVGRAAYYRDWLARGYGANMRYLHRDLDRRADPRRLLPQARSIICAAISYHRPPEPTPNPPTPPAGHVARYAQGRDYHRVLRDLLDNLLLELRRQIPEPFDARSFVDTGPLLERALAEAAGLGWIGRNTCLLNEHHGSYLLLGEIVTTLDLLPDQPVASRCGSCTRCIDSCPTRALVAPYELDARRCIAYMTIEHRGPIDAAHHPHMDACLFGCDICQAVCPYNARAPHGNHPDLTADCLPAHLDLARLLQLSAAEYRRLVRGTPGTRARRNMWRRNAAIVAGNAPSLTPDLRAKLEAIATDDPDPVVRSAAAETLRRHPRNPQDS
jgi:epoxyqueuosine reductase